MNKKISFIKRGKMSWKNWPSWLKGGLVGGLIGFSISSLGHILLFVISLEEFSLSRADIIMLRSFFFAMAYFLSFPWNVFFADFFAYLFYLFAYPMIHYFAIVFFIIFSTINSFIIGSLVGFVVRKIKSRSKNNSY